MLLSAFVNRLEILSLIELLVSCREPFCEIAIFLTGRAMS